jgi:hypothetical protein
MGKRPPSPIVAGASTPVPPVSGRDRFLAYTGYGIDIMTGAVTPSPPLDQIVTVLDRILTGSGMCP